MKELSKIALAVQPSATLAIDTMFKQMRADGLDVIGFGAGEPDFPTPDHIKEAGIQAIQNNDTKYTPSAGTVELRKAVCQRLKEDCGVDYEPSQISVSSGAKPCVYTALRALVDPGDEVILPAPYWVSYIELIRMVGGVTAACSDPAAERGLGEFLRTVPAGRGQYGVNAFLEGYLDALLTCGRAIGEIVPAAGNREIAAVLWGRVEDIEIREGDHPLAFTICGPDEQGRMGPLPCQDLLLFTPLNPEADSPYGVSLLRGLPFLTDILMKIYHTIGINWERCGSLRFAVTCRDGGNGQAEERSRMLAGEWSRAMQDTRSGSVRDFVAVGDVDIQVIGADAPVLDSEVPVRQILEQVVAKTGIPPFMLGLSWSSTERMSSQQADMLTTEITAIRRTITPVVERICRLWLRMHGYTCGFEVLWEDINLQDLVEEARAELYHEQVEELRLAREGKEG